VEGKDSRIVIAGGGTGGHLYPALAVAEELRRREPGRRLEFVGARGGIEERLVPRAGYPLRLLSLGGLKGRRVGARVRAAAAAAWAVLGCTLWMLRARPGLVIGVGGYASGPAVLAGTLLRVKTMVLEQNHFPGATNRWLAPRVDAVCLPSEQAARYVRGRIHVTGNPVRPEFLALGEPPNREQLSLLVFGGSRGARSINQAVAAGLAQLARLSPPPRIVHQTGVEDEAAVRAAYVAYPTGCWEVAAFFDDMPARLGAADLAVCRAGATTLAELCAAGRPSILIPYPHAADDHQRRNAETLVQAGAAALVLDGPDLDRRLVAAIAELAPRREARRTMGQAARSLSRPGAAAAIADVAEGLLDVS
jgi:UDP-N-acetylglucosamine--N-acetylmuramyl-(pentapeptide) pyrophosphoryl-undecaprenol N-acetylglucosamine transferase